MCPYIAIVNFLLCMTGISAGLQCESKKPSNFKFSINSYRNVSGNWIAQAQLQHEADDIGNAGVWEIDIDHTIARCKKTESIFIVATVTAPNINTRQPQAPGYILMPGLGYYKLHTDVRTWHEALQACEDEGTHLAIINSQDEATALGHIWDINPKILDGGPNNWAHIGFHDQYKEGQYVTIFNESLSSTGYVKWHPGEPDGVGSNCGIVVRRDNLLADINCNAKQPFLCEQEL